MESKINSSNLFATGERSFTDALQWNNPEAAGTFLPAMTTLKGISVSGGNPLHVAVRRADDPKWLALLSRFIKKEAELEGTNNEQLTPLAEAFCFADDREPSIVKENDCYLSAAKTLIAAGASLQNISIRGNSPLHMAVMYAKRSDWLKLIPFIIGKGVDLEAKNGDQFTPLAEALYLADDYQLVRIEKNHFLEAAKTLIAAGASLKNIIIAGNNPLHLAIKFALCPSWEELIPLFLANGVELEAKNEEQRTPLAQVLYKLHMTGIAEEHQIYLKIIKMLVNAGASLKEIVIDGYTPLDLIFLMPTWQELVPLFIEKGVELETESKCQRTPLARTLYLANTCMPGDPEVIPYFDFAKALIDGGASLKNVSIEGDGPLHLVIINKEDPLWQELLLYFIEREADLEAKNGQELTPLGLAIYYGNQDIDTQDSIFCLDAARALINAGASLQCTFENGDTFFHVAVRCACSENWQDFLLFLLELVAQNRIDIDAKNNADLSPLQLSLINAQGTDDKVVQTHFLNAARALIRAGASVRDISFDPAVLELRTEPWQDFLPLLIEKYAEVEISIPKTQPHKSKASSLSQFLLHREMGSKRASFQRLP